MAFSSILAVLIALPDNKHGFETISPFAWEDYEFKAYGWDKDTGRLNRPLNKPTITKWFPMSQWTLDWRARRDTKKNMLLRTTPHYYITPFQTRDILER